MTTTALLTAALAACAAPSGTGSLDGETHAEKQTLTVLAAASLRDVFTGLAEGFEAEHDGVTVALSFAGSADLADQLLAGSPGDVLATADTATMGRAVAGGDAADPVVFATNTLTVVVPTGNPGGVTSFADLAREDLKVVVCAAEVPCGSATATVEATAGTTIHRVSEEASVTDVLAKVTAGEADAGLVYVTDATLAGDDVEVIDVPETATVVNTYPIAVTSGVADAALAEKWVDLVTGPVGRAALAKAGFGTP
ncbi:molybdate ABC transporter substrate-binding protein [Oerskovia turbata]|uniref:Molybdate ABC transporter substrate-binding protein n=1 Tax=Oerskovia turbata TaxID=1713 RepID=A0A4Q1KV35_9CELL|nr:molybdate ABC transporter substrate-binding protein [Oerskovia turbata]RXR33299.1 molybdate ABC transporter substrate-binding protein [Oerskovia turbata]TGJ96510.1 molybdate ABC transporter substrate-binding protein [Actinotalea fermentans ATCC 43279 = JCM 9966 = DSM 3133]